MNIVERIGVRVYVRVAGKVDTKLSAGALTWQKIDEGIRFSLPVTNQGNVRLRPKAEVRLAGLNLQAEPLPMSDIETLLPGSTVTMTALWRDPPRYGNGTATAQIVFGDGKHVDAAAALRFFPVLPAVGLLVGVIVVGVIVGVMGIRKRGRVGRRYRRPQEATSREWAWELNN